MVGASDTLRPSARLTAGNSRRRIAIVASVFAGGRWKTVAPIADTRRKNTTIGRQICPLGYATIAIDWKLH